MAGATRAANKRAAAATAAPDENIETITPAAEVADAEPRTRQRFDPEALAGLITTVEPAEKVSVREGSRFGEDHPLYLAYQDSYEKDEARRISTPDPDAVIKGLRKLAVQVDKGVRILSKDAESVTFLAGEKRARRVAGQEVGTDAAVDTE